MVVFLPVKMLSLCIKYFIMFLFYLKSNWSQVFFKTILSPDACFEQRTTDEFLYADDEMTETRS